MPNKTPLQAGVVYIAFGEAYRRAAHVSLYHLRQFGYSGPVRILTDATGWVLNGLECEILELPSVGEGFATRFYKTQANTYGYDTTLLLDADTLPLASISPIWRELRDADICMTLDYYPTVQDLVAKAKIGRERRQGEYGYMSMLGLANHPFFSSGVMLFRRNDATDWLFNAWHEEWKRFQHEDQLALVRAIARAKFRVNILAPHWNGRLKGFTTIERAQFTGIRILHLRPGNQSSLFEFLEESASRRYDWRTKLTQSLQFWAGRLSIATGAHLASVGRKLTSFCYSLARRFKSIA